jgi:alkaline phosphatase D
MAIPDEARGLAAPCGATAMDFSRRRFLSGAVGTAAALVPAPHRGGLIAAAPAVLPDRAARPSIDHGVASGDVSGRSAVVWSRTDRPARLVVEYDTTGRFADPQRIVGPAALPETGLTARVHLEALPPGQRLFYRARFQDLRDLRAFSEPVTGSFRTPAAERRTVKLAFSADTCGQGWGINPELGGLRLYETMRREEPDLFVHLGDTVYADQPLKPEVTLDDGRVWRNVVTEAKSRVAETLDDFRANHLYTLLDEHARRFNAEVPLVVTWDDHEVRDNWYPTQRLDADARYAEKSAALLAARAGRAFLEHYPVRLDPHDPERVYRVCHQGPLLDVFVLDLRSYRGPNSLNVQPVEGPETAYLGEAQLAWLKRALSASTATWKVMACSIPIGLVVRDFPSHFEGLANAHDGAPLGRELEIAGLLRFIRDERIRNVVWIAGDVHYCAAHHYDPRRARFTEFHPFWEFVAGPLHAGTFGPNALDATFGPEVRFVGIPEGMKPNRPPSDGLQFFGTLTIDGRSAAMTARLHDLAGATLYSVEVAAETGSG